jgi:hypothetical protein
MAIVPLLPHAAAAAPADSMHEPLTAKHTENGYLLTSFHLLHNRVWGVGVAEGVMAILGLWGLPLRASLAPSPRYTPFERCASGCMLGGTELYHKT